MRIKDVLQQARKDEKEHPKDCDCGCKEEVE